MKQDKVLKYNIERIKSVFLVLRRKRLGLYNFHKEKYCGKPVLSMAEANNKIIELIESGEPFLVARFGDAELRNLVYSIEIDKKIRIRYPEYIKKAISLNAGFFPPTKDMMLRLGYLYSDAASKVDLYGIWYNFMEEYVIKTRAPEAACCELESLEPYRFQENPWSSHLRGKKVLVVHPFIDSFLRQYAKRELLFNNPETLPDFTLIPYKAINSIGGSSEDFETWFDALYQMEKDISNIDFDVAIVGCGAYGLPLSAFIKSMGKGVIHLAGATQLLFGVRGKRWDERPSLQWLFNEHWIHPDSKEKPKSAKNVEDGCYW